MVISVPNKNGENISIIQQPSEQQKIYKVENDLGIQKKIKSNQKIFNVKTIFFNENGFVSIKGKVNFGKKIELYINKKIMETIKIENSKWQYNSDKIIDYGLHDLLVVLKSDKDEILDKITLPFMRVEMPYNDVPENFILIKPGDMLWTIAYRLYGDPFKYIQIFEENKDQITNPDLIFPGQLFSIPPKE